MIKTFARTLTLAAIAAPLIAFANDGGNFRNGASFYGQPADGKVATRTVDVTTTRVVRVNYGETVKFVKGAEQFAWTFNGMDNRGVPLTKIAPHDFASTVVYVDQDPLNRN
ncbi:CzcE family metal-binding protein [Piscinibacter gummiphilus]|jgi:hypothetical protein|uniref:CzcE family metal-binding protein n=1 Tax=Piscinibacter gummiphilus TaxID=946333 RepID=A0ABZ0D0Z7_9BURK|nr:CzcE family metal-binding protein [Piscinibacter gummiphilus]WOB10853.1 CzcE family metal-binding protein [Piscinibacter gummiphilus]